MRLAVALGVASLVLVAIATMSVGKTRWESWTGPLLVVSNVLVQYYEFPVRHPRAARAYFAASAVIAVAIIASLLRTFA